MKLTIKDFKVDLLNNTKFIALGGRKIFNPGKKSFWDYRGDYVGFATSKKVVCHYSISIPAGDPATPDTEVTIHSFDGSEFDPMSTFAICRQELTTEAFDRLFPFSDQIEHIRGAWHIVCTSREHLTQIEIRYKSFFDSRQNMTHDFPCLLAADKHEDWGYGQFDGNIDDLIDCKQRDLDQLISIRDSLKTPTQPSN